MEKLQRNEAPDENYSSACQESISSGYTKSKFYFKSDFIVIWLISDELCQHLSSIKQRLKCHTYSHYSNLIRRVTGQGTPEVPQLYPSQGHFKATACSIAHPCLLFGK